MVQMVSAMSGHRFNMIRERLADKAELIKFDPWSKLHLIVQFTVTNAIAFHILVQMVSIYRENKKIRSM